MPNTFPVSAATLALSVASFACGSEGALGQAHVSADCPAEDLSCVAQGLDGPLAVGAQARLNVVLDFQGAATPATELRSSHPHLLAVDGDRVRGEGAGHASLLILLAADGATPASVIDFMHVWVMVPDRLATTVFAPDGRELGEVVTGAQLLPGESLVLAPRLYARGQRLLGDPEATWTADADVVTLLREATADRVRLVARKPGTATVSVTSGELSTSFALEVKP
jgi:hypothetical protein